ncbi:nuclear transport factor 2 family protein [Candidatus Poriferisocius sp.]|uniref:nuclear transport factor 2 family protein n=1 Tax=Candidatus Poriferisocius sp. TaxID=3101276 RepID=UPI003B59BC92
MSDESANRAVAEALFEALERMDWAAVAELFTEDGVYQDMPFETDTGGTVGHAGIVAKLEVGLSGLDRFELGVSDIWVSGDTVLVERVEVWHHPGGETAGLPVLCRLDIRDGKIAHWREYWDYNYLIAQQPDTWLPESPRPRWD